VPGNQTSVDYTRISTIRISHASCEILLEVEVFFFGLFALSNI
jgi:hypothetical protein